jgi:hypothetical protein
LQGLLVAWEIEEIENVSVRLDCKKYYNWSNQGA